MGRPLLRGYGRPLASKNELLNLPRSGLRQLGDEGEAVRALEVREPLARVRAELLRRCRRARFEDDEGVRRFTPFLVGQTDNGGFLHGGVAQQYALDLDRRDVL